MIHASQIREVISSYLSHSDADRFVLEFSRLSHNVHKHGDPEAIKLANQIESKLADARGGLMSKSAFLAYLRQIMSPVSNSCYFFAGFQVLSPVNRPAEVVAGREIPAWAGSFGTLSGAVFGSKYLVRS